MNKSVYRMIAGIAASFALALPAAAQVSVVGCLYDSTPPQINDDPNKCPADRKLDVVSLKGSWIQTLSPIGGGGGGAGKVQVGPFTIVKNLDRTSPGLFRDVVTGRHLRGALFVVFDANGNGGNKLQRVFTVLLDDVLISSYEVNAADSRSRNASPMDIVGFAYEKLTVRDDVSGVTQSFDFVQNKQ